jgi:hypothetical protein
LRGSVVASPTSTAQRGAWVQFWRAQVKKSFIACGVFCPKLNSSYTSSIFTMAG